MPRAVYRAYNAPMNHVTKIQCKTALHRHNSKWLPYNYDINVYRGCAHRCIYCYALYSHEYLGADSFYDEVYAKTNITDVLRRELPCFSREPVNFGGITDSYQPAERSLRLMPGVLSLFAEYRIPAVLCTKSTLILRDMELLARVRDAGGLSLAFTVTTLDKHTASLIEPGASPADKRIDALRSLIQNGFSCGIHMMPVIPYLTSDAQSMEAVFSAAKDAGASHVLAGALNLKTSTRRSFFDGIKQSFPSMFGQIAALYNDKQAYSAYKHKLNEDIQRLRQKYKMPAYTMPIQKPSPTQMTFF